jgi:hypothetical protein
MRKRKELEAEMGIALKDFLKELREKDGFSGRLWALGKENPFFGSHADFGRGEEYVTIFVKEGRIVVREYIRSRETKLGKEIKEILLKKGVLAQGE